MSAPKPVAPSAGTGMQMSAADASAIKAFTTGWGKGSGSGNPSPSRPPVSTGTRPAPGERPVPKVIGARKPGWPLRFAWRQCPRC
jgi:hypothetical protein